MKADVIQIEEAEGARLPSTDNNGGGGDQNMQYLRKDVFNQYEKRIDKHLDSIENKVDKIPTEINKDMQILLNAYDEKRRKGNWSIIGFTLTGVGIIVTIAGIIIPMFI